MTKKKDFSFRQEERNLINPSIVIGVAGTVIGPWGRQSADARKSVLEYKYLNVALHNIC